MRKELPKTYEPQETEGKIYQSWLDAGCFKAAPNPDKKPFSIVMPPPQRHRPAPHGARHGLHPPGYPHPL